MRKFLGTLFGAVLLAGCGNAGEIDNEGANAMTDLPAIRDVWDFGDPAASETRFRELAAEAGAAGEGAYAAEAMTQAARTFSLRRDFDQANSILDEVDAGAHGGVPVVRVRSLLERGRTLNSGGEAEAALPLFDQAYRIASEADEQFLAGDAIHMAAIASDLPGEERWMDVLVTYIDETPAPEAAYWIAGMRNNLGWSYFSADRFAEARVQFAASRTAYEAMEGKRYEVLIADYSQGRALRAMGECETALPLQEATFAAIEDEFDTRDEYVAEEIALCRAALGDEDGARAPAAIAFAKYSEDPWFVENEAERLETLRVLSGN